MATLIISRPVSRSLLSTLRLSLVLLILVLKDSVPLLAGSSPTDKSPGLADAPHEIPTASSKLRADELRQSENYEEQLLGESKEFVVIHRHHPHVQSPGQSHDSGLMDIAHTDVRRNQVIGTLKRTLLREKSLNRGIRQERMRWRSRTAGVREWRQLIEDETVVVATGGEYLVQMQLGTPPTPVLLILDTGSGLSWVQCKDCVECSPQQEPLFDPSTSSSYRSLSCQSEYCQPNSSFSSQFQCNTLNNTCEYGVQYGQSSFSTGILSKDELQVPDGSMRLPDFLFGCGLFNVGDFLGSSGLLGLSRSNISFPGQLGIQQPTLGRKFTTCFADIAHNSSATGFISFGNSTTSRTPINNENVTCDHGHKRKRMMYTPFAATPFPTQFYYVELKGISVDGRLLPINSSVLEIDKNGNRGTVIDSGTTLTLLNPGAYGVLRDAFRSAGAARRKLPKVSTGPGLNSTGHVIDTCYQFGEEGNRPEGSAVPSIALHFAGGVKLVLLPDSTLFPFGEGLYCLAFASTQTDLGINVIGNIQQQNLLIEYDLDKSRIGFQRVIGCTNR